MTNSTTTHRRRVERDTSDAALSRKDYIAAIAVGRLEARFPEHFRRSLEYVENVLGAHRKRVVELEVERRELLARMQGCA